MEENIELFKKLIESDLSPEEVYEKIIEVRGHELGTKRIFRGLRNWKNCIYEGGIREHNLLVSRCSSTSLDDRNIAMAYDDYKETMIRFIREFREYLKQNPSKKDNLLFGLVVFSPGFAKSSFNGAGRDGEKAESDRDNVATFNEDIQMKQYKVSDLRRNNRNAVCTERNTTICNAFQFAGFETFLISGILDYKGAWEGHTFVLVKHSDGKGGQCYALIDSFNNIADPNFLPGTVDITGGFENVAKKTELQYSTGQMLEVTRDVLRLEKSMRRVNAAYDKITAPTQIDYHIEKLNALENVYTEILIQVKKGDMHQVFKDRLIKYINNCLENINKKKAKLGNTGR